jgi:NAD(P)-dependent dehydrogenase (short-subunit alcohol dehydrogenase family)
MRLAGKIAIISGAASGMGAATARMFVREGAKVVPADALEHEGRQVADAIGASGTRRRREGPKVRRPATGGSRIRTLGPT